MDDRAFWKQTNGFRPDGSTLKILAVPSDPSASAYYRVICPAQKLAEIYPNAVDVRLNPDPLGRGGEEDLTWADVVWTNNISQFGGLYTARLCALARELGKFFHYDTDDLLTVTFSEDLMGEVYRRLGLADVVRLIYQHADLVSVTQPKFAERIKPDCDGILSVIPNAIDFDLPCWNLPKRPASGPVRVGWAGGSNHVADLRFFADIPKQVNDLVGRDKVHWNFYGRQAEAWSVYQEILNDAFGEDRNWDCHDALPFDQYGSIYSQMDIAVAPLTQNEFNDSKSAIKAAECGRYAVPLVASAVGAYPEAIANGVSGYLIDPDSPKREWVRTLADLIRDGERRRRMGETLKQAVDETYDLNRAVHRRLALYRLCLERKEGRRIRSARG